MDKETLEKIGGKVTWMEVPYTTTKLSVETGNNKWQTAGGDTVVARVEVGSEADPQAVFSATREWLQQLAIEANKATLNKLNTAYKAYHQPPEPSVTQHTEPTREPIPQHAGMLEGTAKTFVVETLSVDIKSGKRYMKAKGGNYSKYGVNVWEEIAAKPPLEWNLQELDGADYPAPPGLTAIYIEKVIQDKEGNDKVVPDKVTGWA